MAISCRSASKIYAPGGVPRLEPQKLESRKLEPQKLESQQRRKIRDGIDDVIGLHGEFVCGPTL